MANIFEFLNGGGMGGGFGGFPGGMGGMGGPPRRKGDSTKLYKELGLETKATADEIKRAYRKLARKWHPDRPNGNIEKFKAVQNAYDVLSDPAKKKAYDLTGDPNADPRTMARYQKRKGKTTKFELEVPLEQFYNGHTRRIRVTKTVICAECDGEGGEGKAVCHTCRGRGVRIVDRQIGRGMIQRMQMECNVCDGNGWTIPASGLCQACSGVGMKKASSILSVHVEKGMKHGAKITFSGEGDQRPDTRPGDVVVILRRSRRKHPTFSRTPDGCHLIYEKKISLIEALTGFKFYITHLDDRVLEVKSRPNAIYKTGDIEAIKDEGMPLRGDVTTRGHLYVKFTVVYPTNLTQAQQQTLVQLLGPKNVPAAPDVEEDLIENHNLVDVDIEQEKREYAKMLKENPNMYDEDEDDGRGGGEGIPCRTQ